MEATTSSLRDRTDIRGILLVDHALADELLELGSR